MSHRRRTCGAWLVIYGVRRVCSYDKRHDGDHSWQVKPPKPRGVVVTDSPTSPYPADYQTRP